MSNKIPNSLFVLIAFSLCFVLYWPAMNGQPIWDDLPYFFNHPSIINEFSYWTIIKDFAWPVSVLGQKFLFGIFKFHYASYHFINLTLHGLNAWMLLKIAQKIKLPFPRLLFLFFLLHPSNVITVSWIIQFKTILCMTFALLSVWFFLKVHEKKFWYVVSFFFFALSLFSKTASIALPAFYTLYLWFHASKKELLWIIPFFAVSLFGVNRILKSPVTEAGIATLESHAIQETQPTPIAAETSSLISQAPIQKSGRTPEKADVESKTKAAEKDSPRETFTQTFFQRWDRFVQTIHYYFWQTLLPLRNEPIKGHLYSAAGVQEYLHLSFLILMLVIHWGSPISFYLVTGYIMCAPFLGIFSAPYMNLTWVSDQHLYLAMPFFICFWLELITKWKYKYSLYLPYAFLPAYCYLVFTSTPFYENEVSFFEASLEVDPLNAPVAYNLAVAHIINGNISEAKNVTSTMVNMKEVVPEITKNKYFSYVLILDMQLHSNEKSP